MQAALQRYLAIERVIVARRGLARSGLQEWPLSISGPSQCLPIGFDGWFAVVAPTGTPAEATAGFSGAITAFLNDFTSANQLSGFGCIPNSEGTPQLAAAFLQAERERWRAIVQELDIKPQ